MSDPTAPDAVDILLVDDQESNLQALAAILARPDYNLVLALSANEALKHIMERDFAVVLMDVMMPGFDGFECAKLIKQRWRSRETPIIFVTAVAYDLSFIFRGYDAGAVDYIAKPLEPSVVRAKVAVFAQLFRRTRLLQAQLEEMRRLCEGLEAEVAAGQRDAETLTGDLRAFVRGCEQRLEDFAWQRTGWRPAVHQRLPLEAETDQD